MIFWRKRDEDDYNFFYNKGIWDVGLSGKLKKWNKIEANGGEYLRQTSFGTDDYSMMMIMMLTFNLMKRLYYHYSPLTGLRKQNWSELGLNGIGSF